MVFNHDFPIHVMSTLALYLMWSLCVKIWHSSSGMSHFRDRVRSSSNTIGIGFGVLVAEHLCKGDLDRLEHKEPHPEPHITQTLDKHNEDNQVV